MAEASKITSFKDLVIWQRSMALVVRIYQCTQKFPREEIYGLTAQIRRAAVSIPSNIAEGQSRRSDPAFAYHLDIALGSAAELETQLTIALEISYISSSDYDPLISELTEIVRMIHGLRSRLKRSR
jgi:four helix bundle protein